MSHSTKLFIALIASFFLLGCGVFLTVSAQEEGSAQEPEGVGGGYSPVVTSVEEAVTLDEDIQPADLGIGEPRILPDSPFYFLKNWGRGIRSLLTFNPVAKAELKLKFSNEKLMEIKKMVEKTENPEIIKKAAENYQKELERIKTETEKIKEKAEDNPRVESFLDKFIEQQTLHQKLLQKLETQVPAEALDKIEEARERHLERFQEVMLKLEDRQEKITETLDEVLKKQEGSEFKEFKNLEVLKNLEEKVPEEAKEAIQKAQENALKRLRGDLEKMSSEDQEKFKDYLEKISGEKEKQLEIMEDLKTKVKEAPETPKILELKEKLEEGKEKIFEKIGNKLEKLGCPIWTLPAPGFCKEGRVIIERNPETDCPLPPKCLIPGEIEIPAKPLPTQLEKPGAVEAACIALWDPVCGKDGKTYSNACFAKLAGEEIAYKGKCEEKECQTDADCPQLKCGPAGTISAKCIGLKAKCMEGKCEIQSCPEIMCVWDPCPGKHIPDQRGCINCASPCQNGPESPIESPRLPSAPTTPTPGAEEILKQIEELTNKLQELKQEELQREKD